MRRRCGKAGAKHEVINGCEMRRQASKQRFYIWPSVGQKGPRMIASPRLRKAALTVISALAAIPCAAQPAMPPTTAKDTLLTTTTPLGEAAIVRPAGSEVTEPVGEGGEIVLREGPFTARLDRTDLVFPAPPPASPAPTTGVARQPEDVDGDLQLQNPAWQEDWRILVPTGAAVLLGIYSIIATVALLRRRRRWDE